MNQKPKLLVVHPAADIGGAEICTRDLLSHLQLFDAVLLTQSALRICFAGNAVKTYFFDDAGCGAPYTLTPGNIWKYARVISVVAQKEKPDAIIGMTHNGMVYATLANDMNFARSRIFSVIAGHFSTYFSTIIKRPPNFSEKLLMRYCFSRTAGIIVPSFGVRTDLVSHFKANPAKVKTIHNGMNLQAIRKDAGQVIELATPVGMHNSAQSMTKNCPWIVSACRLSPPKDIETLLHAFRLVRNKLPVRLLIIGEGELRGSIEALVGQLGLTEDVWMLGFCTNPFPYMAIADVFVLSSLTEGFGNVIVEAMTLGVPVVATDCPVGPAEIIEQGHNGYLVPVKDPQAMAQCLLMLLTDGTLHRRISENARVRSDAFSIEKMAAEYENYILNAL